MRWEGLAAACAAGLLVATVSATEGDSLPKPWYRTGSAAPADKCRATTSDVKDQPFDKSLVIKCEGLTQGFVSVMQSFNPVDYRGKRIRLSAQVRGDGLREWAGLWMRVDGANGKVLAFDNMQSRVLKGTFDWQPAFVVLDVAPDAALVAFGVLQIGDGALYAGGLAIDVVGNDVKVTTKAEPEPTTPGNLSLRP